jgi:DNA-binding SARP family transcriptional activator
LSVARNGIPLELPASRKVRALLAYLALSQRAVGRGRLCEIFWDVPDDPRGELRWCLSKLRGILDEPDRRRVIAGGGTVSLDLAGCTLDVADIAAAERKGMSTLAADALEALSELFAGDFLEGLEVGRSPEFDSWLAAQRRKFRHCHAAVLECLAASVAGDGDKALPYLERWVDVAPLDARAHVALLGALAARGRAGDCEEHLTAAAKVFEAEDLDFGPVLEAWRTIKAGRTGLPRIAAVPVSQTSLPVLCPADGAAGRRASLAVMPFAEQSTEAGARSRFADGLTCDIITRLAKLRSLFIIARGSVFALADRGVGPEEAGRRLNVDYVASGAVRRQGGRVIVTVELVEARTAVIIWTETFDHKAGEAFFVLDEIGNRIVSSIANEIELVERNRAILKPPSSLDAWEAYHRGLWHMYRFTSTDNDLAQHFFEMAIGLDPAFARAHAGLSFTHWQNAFQRWADRQSESDLAFEAAGRALIVDDRDPAAHWAMGRILWLRGRQDDSLGELERAVDLSPNFALGHYALSFVHSQSGDPLAAIRSADQSCNLSPFDPLLFGMFGARAMAHVRLGQFEEAGDWAMKAAARPNAHLVIQAIAAHCLGLTDRLEEGRAFAAAIRKIHPEYRVEDFLATFRFAPDAADMFRRAAARIGLA